MLFGFMQMHFHPRVTNAQSQSCLRHQIGWLALILPLHILKNQDNLSAWMLGKNGLQG